ncbi:MULTISPECIES: ABC transporter substrate-binding protein [Halobacterium]|uniref:ABC transporter substrate-binding protein n=1 Tax=Halobacterium TaxID=2239 RepID=UPI00073E8BB9|nr:MULTISPECIES: ABC transporter substrate-binding protein [Halobacterium]MCG1004307.1 ABC transporter substrate-binding protein [Halobacterium noricense]
MTDTDNLSRRRFLQGTGAAATAAALAGCTGGDGDSGGTTNGTTERNDENRYRGRQVGTADSMDPIYATDTTSGAHINNIFDGLTNYVNGTVNVETLLATDYTVSEDSTTITFQLKEGATYNNGTEVTASDVVYAWERLAASDNSNRAGFILDTLGVVHETETDSEGNETYVPGSIAVEATSDYEVTVTLSEPFYAALELIAYSAFVPIPEGIVGDIEGYDGEMDYDKFASSDPVGAGPYELVEWSEATTIRLDARDDYHGDEILNEGLDYSVFTESNAAFTYATSNVNADSPYIPSAKYDPSLRNFEGTDDRGRQYGTYGPFDPNDMTAQYYEVPTLSTYYYAFDTQNVEKPVRQAVAHAMDQQAINDQVINTPGKPGYFFTPPALFPGGAQRYNELQSEYPYGQTAEIDQARQVMEDAGYGPNNQYTLAFDMPSSTASSWGEQAYSLLRDKLQQAHINLEFQSADWSTFLNRGRNGNFELYYLGWIADYPGADNFLSLINPPNTFFQQGGSSYLRWSEETGDAAGDAKDAWETVQNNLGFSDEAASAREEAYLELERANWEDAVLLPFQHGITQSYSYDWIESPRFGAMGPSRKKSHRTEIGDRGEYQ